MYQCENIHIGIVVATKLSKQKRVSESRPGVPQKIITRAHFEIVQRMLIRDVIAQRKKDHNPSFIIFF